MAESSLINIDGIGPVLFERSRRARHISITVKSSSGVRVAVPRRSSIKQAREFVNLKKSWIKKHLEKLELAEQHNRLKQADMPPIDRAEAGKILVNRLEYLARKHGFEYNRVSIRQQKTRWGSCSSLKNISLNAQLVRLPADLMDYVLLHELVHTRIYNHSPRFWAELDRYAGNARAMSKRLRQTGLGLL